MRPYRSLVQEDDKKIIYSVLDTEDIFNSLKRLSTKLEKIGVFLNYTRNGDNEVFLSISKSPILKNFSSEDKKHFSDIVGDLKLSLSEKFKNIIINEERFYISELDGSMEISISVVPNDENLKDIIVESIFKYIKELRKKGSLILPSVFRKTDGSLDVHLTYE